MHINPKQSVSSFTAFPMSKPHLCRQSNSLKMIFIHRIRLKTPQRTKIPLAVSEKCLGELALADYVPVNTQRGSRSRKYRCCRAGSRSPCPWFVHREQEMGIGDGSISRSLPAFTSSLQPAANADLILMLS